MIQPRLNAIAPAGIVFLGGANLILIQWVLVRELTTLLLGTELVILLVSAAYFLGLSAGYWVSGRIRRAWLQPLGILTLLLHVFLPVWLRLFAIFFDAAGIPILTFTLLPLLTVLLVPAFYSVFLPLFVDDGKGQLPALYALELLGSAAGIGILVLFGHLGWLGMAFIYAVNLLLILALLHMPQRAFIGWVAITTFMLIVLPGLNMMSNGLWFQQIQGLPAGTTTLYSAYSPYQKVDVMQTPGGRRYLFLDGLEHFGGEDGSMLNIILGAIPAEMLRPQQALVIGAGSMEMEALIADYAGQVTTVEIDPLVVDASLQYFDAFNRISSLQNRTIIIDDAKHYLMNTRQTFDLIATDTPAAFTIQTATLYSVPFYQAMKNRLTPGGIVAINLTGDFAPDELIPRRVVASLQAVFGQVMVVTSGKAGWSFAYAADSLPFGRELIEARLRYYGDNDYAIFMPDAVPLIVGAAAPITLDSMDLVLQTSAEYIEGRLR